MRERVINPQYDIVTRFLHFSLSLFPGFCLLIHRNEEIVRMIANISPSGLVCDFKHFKSNKQKNQNKKKAVNTRKEIGLWYVFTETENTKNIG